MRRLPTNFCADCYSHCAQQGAFTLHSYHKGEQIVFPKNKNYMIFVLSGSVQVRSESIEVFDCLARQIILSTKNGEYSIRATEECELLVLSFVRAFQICDRMTTDEVDNILGDYHYTYHSLKFNEQMEILVESIVKLIEDDVDCVYMHNAKQFELFVVCKFYYSRKELGHFFMPILNKNVYFEALVKAHYSDAKNVKEFANLCGYSLNKFKKEFKYHFKVSPYQWMLQQNKTKILTLLLDNSIPIKVVAAEFGFTSQSHLNRYCNRYLGATSAQIRKGKNNAKKEQANGSPECIKNTTFCDK